MKFAILIILTLFTGSLYAQMECFEDIEEESWPSEVHLEAPAPQVTMPARAPKPDVRWYSRFRVSDQAIWKLQMIGSAAVSAYQSNDALTSTRHMKGRGMREAQMGSVVLSGSVEALGPLVRFVRERRRHRILKKKNAEKCAHLNCTG